MNSFPKHDTRPSSTGFEHIRLCILPFFPLLVFLALRNCWLLVVLPLTRLCHAFSASSEHDRGPRVDVGNHHGLVDWRVFVGCVRGLARLQRRGKVTAPKCEDTAASGHAGGTDVKKSRL